MRDPEHRRLKRLEPVFYEGRAYVHWTLTMHDRQSDWLSPSHHNALREILFHTCARYFLCCPVYCLMPDHGHFLFVGLHEEADQLAALPWMRRAWNRVLSEARLQDQAYEHVLRESDRARDAFAEVVAYILHNPLRKDLVGTWQEWPYSGAVFPGYPKMDPRKIHFWENFWTAYARQGGHEL
jgi:REP element-mobilizing transposase RayT